MWSHGLSLSSGLCTDASGNWAPPRVSEESSPRQLKSWHQVAVTTHPQFWGSTGQGITHLSKCYGWVAVVARSLSHVRLFVTAWTVALQSLLFSALSSIFLKLMSVESVMPSNHLILYHPLLLLPSIFPSIMVFSSELALCIRWPKYWSFSFTIVLPINIPEYWLVGSPCSPRDSQESSPAPQLESINSSGLSLLHGPILTFIHDYWTNHSFDCMHLCWQTDVSAF